MKQDPNALVSRQDAVKHLPFIRHPSAAHALRFCPFLPGFSEILLEMSRILLARAAHDDEMDTLAREFLHILNKGGHLTAQERLAAHFEQQGFAAVLVMVRGRYR